MKQDICSMTIGEKRVFTFMTQALGLMADLDLGTFSEVLDFGKYLTEISSRNGTPEMDGRSTIHRWFYSRLYVLTPFPHNKSLQLDRYQ